MKVLALVMVAAAVTACSTPSTTTANDLGPHAERITQGEFGGYWPLTVSAAILRCHPVPYSYGMITLTIQGVEFAVNGVARDQNRWLDFESSRYWRHPKNALIPQQRVDIGPMIQRGLRLC